MATPYHVFREVAVEYEDEDEARTGTGYVYFGSVMNTSPDQAIKQVVAAQEAKGRFYATPARSWKGLEVQTKVVVGATQLDFGHELEEPEDEPTPEPDDFDPPLEADPTVSVADDGVPDDEPF